MIHFKMNTKLKFGWGKIVLIIVLLGFIAFNIPMPYYLIQPGTAEELRPMIQVEGASTEEEGNFLLTTVYLGEANLLTYGYARWVASTIEILDKEVILQEGESPEQYSARQELVMDKSQNEAILVAFKAAGIPIEVDNEGVMILMVLDNMPAAKVLKVGDIIRAVNEQPILAAEEIIEQVKVLKPGDQVKLNIERDGKQQTVEVEIALFDEQTQADTGSPKAGIGIAFENYWSIEPSREVTIDAGSIGGPSAGLMFSLEIYNQLTPVDYTKGHQIAGTGTINEVGEVGQIGGIEFKIIAADKKGADIFFVTKDIQPNDSNEKKALQTAKRIGTKMKIVPVATFKEAIQYLEQLEPQETLGYIRIGA